MENWRNIKHFEGKYQVSNLGQVKSLQRLRKSKNGSTVLVPEKILKQRIDKDGYHEVALCTGKHKQAKYFRVHRLVAEAFPEICGEPFPGAVVNHKDENVHNNTPENLHFCTTRFNYMYSLGTAVNQYSLDGKLIRTYPTVALAAEKTKTDRSSIFKCFRGKLKTAGGYIWRRF